MSDIVEQLTAGGLARTWAEAIAAEINGPMVQPIKLVSAGVPMPVALAIAEEMDATKNVAFAPRMAMRAGLFKMWGLKDAEAEALAGVINDQQARSPDRCEFDQKARELNAQVQSRLQSTPTIFKGYA